MTPFFVSEDGVFINDLFTINDKILTVRQCLLSNLLVMTIVPSGV
jgi:hypothetical protein